MRLGSSHGFALATRISSILADTIAYQSLDDDLTYWNTSNEDKTVFTHGDFTMPPQSVDKTGT